MVKTGTYKQNTEFSKKIAYLSVAQPGQGPDRAGKLKFSEI